MVLFGKETFEGGSIPASFDVIETNWGDATVTLDNTAKINGAYSLKFSNTGEGSAYARKSLDDNYDEIYIQFSGFIPTDFAFGASSFCNLFTIFDSDFNSRIYANIEDWGTVRLTFGEDVAYTNSTIDLPKNEVFKLEVYIKKNATTGRIKVWLNNDVEGSPDFDSGNVDTGASPLRIFRFGKSYVPEAVGDYYMDDFRIATTFIGNSNENFVDSFPTSFTWKGYSWQRRTYGGGPQYNGSWTRSNVIGPDENDYMTLKVSNPTGTAPIAGEFFSQQSGWGYGTYLCVVDARLDNMDKNTVFGGLFTYDSLVEPHHNEIDVCEVSAWGQNVDVRLSHTFWRDNLGNNEAVTDDITMPDDQVHTHRMIWTPNSLTFDSFVGVGTGGDLIKHTEYDVSDNIPIPANEKVLFNAWVFGGGTEDPDTVTEKTFIIRDFSFTPYEAPEIIPSFTIEINNVDKTSDINFDTFRITDNINQKVDTCFFSTKKFKPTLGQEIVVYHFDNVIFGGVIVKIETEINNLITTYKVSCKDYTHYLDRELVTERYENETVADIISNLLTEYAPTFTSTNVVGDTVIGQVSFNKISISQSIQILADTLNYSWYVDYDKDIHFFPKNTELAPYNLTNNGVNFIWNSLKITEDFSQIRNSIYVIGGELKAETRTEKYIADGEQQQFPLAYKFAELPVVEVNNTPVTVGIDNLDLEANFDVFWNFTQKYIRFKSSNIPVADDVIEITGDPLFPIIVRVPDQESIATYGIYEYKIRDSNIKTRDAAIERGRVELEAYANSINEGSFDTYIYGLRSGQVININVGSTNEDFIIQSVSMRMISPFDAVWSVQLATARTLGIITFLQKLLLDNEPIDQAETLLELLEFDDETGVDDVLTLPSDTTSPPYYWGDAPINGNVGKWNFFTWG